VEAADVILAYRPGERVELARITTQIVGLKRRDQELPDLVVERHLLQRGGDPPFSLGVEGQAAGRSLGWEDERGREQARCD
jgi:hypothetical protein